MSKFSLIALAIVVSCVLDSFAVPEVGSNELKMFKKLNGSRTGRIIRGHEASPGQFPHQGRLTFLGKTICGAVIISEKHLLTAAHCIRTPLTAMSVLVGDHSISTKDGEQMFLIEEVVIHEAYSKATLVNDIALIKLDGKMKFKFTLNGYGSIHKIPLPINSAELYRAEELFLISGWGKTELEPQFDRLRFVEAPDFNLDSCKVLNKAVGITVTDYDICAGFKAGEKSPCDLDSGGPLVRLTGLGYELVGIFSRHLKPCGLPGFPVVYTRVASYIEWILLHKNL